MMCGNEGDVSSSLLSLINRFCVFVSTPEKVFCFSNKLLSQVYMFLQTVVLEFQPKSFTWLNELHSSGKILAFSLLLKAAFIDFKEHYHTIVHLMNVTKYHTKYLTLQLMDFPLSFCRYKLVPTPHPQSSTLEPTHYPQLPLNQFLTCQRVKYGSLVWTPFLNMRGSAIDSDGSNRIFTQETVKTCETNSQTSFKLTYLS